MDAKQIQRLLSDPFEPEELEWKVQSSGIWFDGTPWVRAIAYADNRAIQKRLDDVLGPMNWRNEFEKTEGGFLCGLSIRIDGEWITKWDGADSSHIEKLKGSISNSMKRAAVQFGIGRYLYWLDLDRANVIKKFDATPEQKKNGHYATVYKDNKNKRKQDSLECYWFSPDLPDWAHPKADFYKYLDAIENATDMESMRKAYHVAYRSAEKVNRIDVRNDAIKIKDSKKAELEAKEQEDSLNANKKFITWLNTAIKDRIATAENESVLNMNHKHLLQELKGKCKANKVDSSNFVAQVNQAHTEALNNLRNGV